VSDLNPIIGQFNHTAVMICETQISWMQVCADQLSDAMPKIEEAAASASEDFWSFSPDSFLARIRPYEVKNGVLRIPVKGLLMSKFPYTLGNWATGYEYIWEAVKRGMDDSEVKGIALLIDSPGGAVAGLLEFVDKVFELRGQKPIQAFADTKAFSAAYAIASVADRITVARSGGVGSIGVIITHAEMSKQLEMRGITVTNIRSKPRKGEGGPFEPLSKAAQARLQASVDHSHKEFVALVARNRGMGEAAVEATEALPYLAHEAVENGLADEIGALDDAITAFVASLDPQEVGDNDMAENNQADSVAQADHDAAVAAATEAGRTAGVNEERARMTAILGSDAAENRPAAAMMMVELGTDAETAIEKLAKLPEETKAESSEPGAQEPEKPTGAGAPAGMLESAMQGSQNPDLGAGDGGELNDEQKAMAQLSSDIKSMGLPGFKADK
jgi:signal peptide peptidase SppA